MAKLLRLRRGTDTQHTTFTGAEGEVTVNTTNDSLHVHDGSTAGGTELAKADLSNVDGTLSNNLRFGDNIRATFGAGDDLKLYHDSNNSYIEDAGTGSLIVRATNLQINNAGNTQNYISATDGGSAVFYHAGNAKLSTESTGIDVTGTATCDGLTSTGTNILENTDEPQLILRDSDSAGSGARVQLEARGNDNGVDWFIGHTSTSDGSVTFRNEDNQPIYFGTNGSNRCEVNANGHFCPAANNTYDLGTTGQQWRNAYFDGTVNCDGLTCEGSATIISGNGVLFLQDSNNTGNGTQCFVSGRDQNNTEVWYIGQTSTGSSNVELINTRTADIVFGTTNTTRAVLQSDGHFRPTTNNLYDLGTNTLRWRNVYTNDLNLSNEGSANDVDGTWGSWTIQEGEDDLFLLNRRNGKKYKFNLSEVN